VGITGDKEEIPNQESMTLLARVMVLLALLVTKRYPKLGINDISGQGHPQTLLD